MYHCILVPLDGSKRAEVILPHVEEFALRFNAKLVFLQVVEPPPLMMGSETPYLEGFQEKMDEVEKEAERYLDTLSGEFREKGMPSKIHIAHGPVVDGIINAAKSEHTQTLSQSPATAGPGSPGSFRAVWGSASCTGQTGHCLSSGQIWRMAVT